MDELRAQSKMDDETPTYVPSTPPHEDGKGPRRVYLLFGVSGVVFLLVIAGLASFISGSSLPGEPLYAVKTQVVEGTILHTKLGADARATYDVTLLRKRLDELTTLKHDAATTSEESLAAVAKLIDRHTEDAVKALGNNEKLAPETRIDRASELLNITNAEEGLIDTTEEFASMKDSAEETQDKAAEYLKSAIDAFVQTSPPETVYTYLATQIQLVSEDMAKVAHGSTAERLALARTNDTKEAIMDAELGDALTSILKAREAIAADQYLFDAERGPVDGVQLEPTAIPEGS